MQAVFRVREGLAEPLRRCVQRGAGACVGLFVSIHAPPLFEGAFFVALAK